MDTDWIIRLAYKYLNNSYYSELTANRIFRLFSYQSFHNGQFMINNHSTSKQWYTPWAPTVRYGFSKNVIEQIISLQSYGNVMEAPFENGFATSWKQFLGVYSKCIHPKNVTRFIVLKVEI